jgi:hypothetical protein
MALIQMIIGNYLKLQVIGVFLPSALTRGLWEKNKGIIQVNQSLWKELKYLKLFLGL